MSDETKRPGDEELPAEETGAEAQDSEGAGEETPAEQPPEKSEEELAAEKAKADAEAQAKAEAAAKAKAAKEAAEAAKPPWEKLPVAPPDEDAADDPLIVALREAHGEAIESAAICAGDLRVMVSREAIAEVCSSLKTEHGYTMAEDLCGVHYPGREEGEFEVVYHLFNIDEAKRLRLKVVAGEGETVPTTVEVFQGMNWLEREAYDMYGIRFEGHPDMTRILLWEGFNGYPLRKDFPVEGIDTGSAIYPEYYEESAGPVTGTGTGWRPAPPPEPEPEPEAESESAETEGEG